MSNKQEATHDEHTRLISLKPQLIGLDGIVLSTAEANLRNKRGVIVRQPDNLLFDYKNKTIYNVEYKCHNKGSQEHHAVVQLKNSYLYLKRIFGDWRIVNLYVHDNYAINIIK